MKKIILYVVFAAVILMAAPCRADLAIEQECRSVTRVKTMATSWMESTYDYRRRILIKDAFLAVQLIVNGIPTREYGFDFKSKIYYESDLINKEYRKYFFSAINEEYAKRKTMEMGSPERPDRRGGPVGKVGMSFADLKVKSTKALFAKKKVGSLSCILYRYEIGPGYSPFQPLSWGTDIKAWVTKDIPGYALYEEAADLLRKECAFYLAKSNEISDLIIALMYSDGFPVEIHDLTRRDYGVGRLFEESHATLVRVDTAPIPDGTISYLADTGAFILNAASPDSAQDQRRFGPAIGMSSSASGRLIQLRRAPVFEVLALIILGAIFIMGLRYMAVARRRKKIADFNNAMICPHCRAIIAKVYIECPKCGKPTRRESNGAGH